MSWIGQLERRLKRFAIPNLMMYIIALNIIVFVLDKLTVPGRVIGLLALDPFLAMHGEAWRIISFIFIPPTTNFIWFALVMYFYYLIGNSLESVWGSFRFNLYYFIGVLATIGAAFISMGVVTSSYLYLSLFLAFAYIFPDYEIMLFFIIPIKVKYLAWLDLAYIGFTVLASPLPFKLAAIAPLAAYLIFFGKDLWAQARMKRTVHQNRSRFMSQMSEPRTGAFHHCTVCGKTELTDPKMFFRYCSSCEGNHEYCEDHLKNHEHIKEIH